MPTQIEARRLSGIDRGKTISIMVPGGRRHATWLLEGELKTVTHWGDGKVSITVLRVDGPVLGSEIPPETTLTITGKAS